MSKAPRGDFALPGGRFPLNTTGRVQVADKDAAIARKAGTITPAQEAQVKAAVAAKRSPNATSYTHSQGRFKEAAHTNPDNRLPVHARHGDRGFKK